MIYFAILFFIILILLGILKTQSKKDVCTYCLKKFKHTTLIHDQVALCDEHYKLYKSSKIEPFISVKCSSLNDENGIFLYNYSQELKEKGIYNHIISQYELDNDEIQTIQTLYINQQNQL